MEPALSQPSGYRDVLPVITAIALAVLALLVFSATWSRNETIRARVTDDMRAELRDRVSAWELELQRQLDDAVLDVRQASDLGEVQRRLVRRLTWFDSLFAWTPRRKAFDGQQLDGAVVFPPAEKMVPTPEADACVEQATQLLVSSPASLPPCIGQQAVVAVRATNGAAEQLLTEGRPGEAGVVLTRASFVDLGPLGKWRSDPMMLGAVARHRALSARAHLGVGNSPDALELATRLARDTATLDARSLMRALPVVLNLLDLLQIAGQDTAELRKQLDPAVVRMNAWTAIEALPDHRQISNATEGPHFAPASTDDGPWALFVVPPDTNGRGLALLVLTDRLREDFLHRDASHLYEAVTILDEMDRAVGGVRDSDIATETEVPFTFALRNEGVAYTRASVEARVQPLLEQWWNLRNVVTSFCIVLGYGALFMFTRAERQHRELLRRQRDLTTRVTHELKTPLAGIKVMAENISSGAYRDEAQRQHMAERIISEADRLTLRVNEILNFGRQPPPLTLEPFDMEEIVLDAIDEWGPRYEEQDVQLHCDVDPVDPIPGDARAMRDVIGCLLDNALKYRRTDVDSKVWLDVRGQPDATELIVTDNGLGVPASDRARIFESFVRIEGPNRGLAGGHGLGLAQVMAVVKAHRGTVTCEDGVDGGARFRVRLPLTGPTR